MTKIIKNTEIVTNSGTNVSLKLIRQAADEGWIRPLALFHSFKASYGNSTIFDYRSRMPEIASKYGISVKTLYNYLKVLKAQELVYPFSVNKNNLSLKSIRKIKCEFGDKRKTQIHIAYADSLWNIQCRLFAKIIESHLKKMAFNEAFRRFGIHDKHSMGLSANEFRPSFSIRNTAKLLNISEKTAQKVINTLELFGILKITKSRPKKISDSRLPVNLLLDYPGYLFITDKGTFQMFGHSIETIQYPVSIKTLNYQRWLKIYKSKTCKKSHNL